MSELKQHTEQFFKRGIEHLQKRNKDAILQVKNNLQILNQSIAGREDSMAMSDWVTVANDKTPSSLVAPSKLRFGDLQLYNFQGSPVKGATFPLLLPTDVNAVMMNLGVDAEKVPNLFQNIILRLLLSMRMDLVKISVVDMDFGASFPFISTITNSMFKYETIYRQEEVTKLIAELAKEISEANRNFLGNHSGLDAYNLSAGEMAQPYHFVFIDDFPNGFTSQSVEDLIRLISNGNAARAGIKFFINYSRKNPAPREFDLTRFSSNCSWINMSVDGKVSFDGFSFKCPPRTFPVLDLQLTEKASEYVGFINNIKQREVTYSLDSWIESLRNKDEIWKGSTADGIRVPVGYITPTKTFDFYMANDNDGNCNDFFALIAGRPGYGKTVLLHNIIVNSAMKYSPEELCFYLADFAEGASFSIYRKLPHVKALMLANNKEYALRMLEQVVKETKERSILFQKAQRKFGKQVTNLASYRELTGEKLPRILFVMDEFHYLFLSTDMTTIKAKETLCNGIRQWRKFGISIILCTQSISGVQFGDADNQITYRFALNLLDTDSKTVIRNNAATALTRKGQTIMNNTADGRVDQNVEFQAAFTKKYFDHVEYLSDLYVQKFGKTHNPFICEVGTDVDVAENLQLHKCLSNGVFKVDDLVCDVFLGKPDLLRSTHTRIRYRRQQNSNTLIFGDDYKTLIYDVMIQLIQLQRKSSSNSKFYLVDCFNMGDVFQGAFDGTKSIFNNVEVGHSHNICQFVDEISNELEKRKDAQKEGRMTEERVVLTILNAQNCYDLKPQPGEYGMLDQSETTKKLIVLMSEGAPLGIHSVIHGLSYETLFKSNDILEYKHFSMFENMIFLKGADVDNMFLGGLKISAPEEGGQMVVLNAKVDGEPYELCNAYSDITAEKQNATVKFMSNLFEKYRYV